MLQPWVLGLQLMEMQYMQLGFDPQQGVEQQLEQRARRTASPSAAWKQWTSSSACCRACRNADQARFLDMVVTEMHDVEQ